MDMAWNVRDLGDESQRRTEKRTNKSLENLDDPPEFPIYLPAA
jgi:hypothetical protein